MLLFSFKVIFRHCMRPRKISFSHRSYSIKIRKYVYSHQTMVYTIIHHIHLKTEGNYFLVEIVISLTNATNDIMKYKIDIISLYITFRTPFGFKYPLATNRLRTIRLNKYFKTSLLYITLMTFLPKFESVEFVLKGMIISFYIGSSLFPSKTEFAS